jgi:hypothetical protein
VLAVISVREMMSSKKAGTIKFKDKSNKTWNCNKEELIGNITAGERYYIDYNESTFDGRNGPVTMKWVNNARFWREGDGPDTFEEKEPYNPGGYSGNSGGGKSMSKSDYDPEIGKRQTAANVAGPITLKLIEGVPDAEKLDAFALNYPVVAEIVLKFVNDKGSLATVSLDGSPPLAMGDEHEDFGFGD